MYRKQTGIGLVAAIFLIVVVSMLAVAMTAMVKSSSDEFAQNVIDHRALLAAESGAQLGLNKVFAPRGIGACANWTFDLDSAGLPACQAVVQCRSTTVAGVPHYTLESDGRCGVVDFTAQRRILVRATP